MSSTTVFPSTIDILADYGDLSFADPMAMSDFITLTERFPELKMERSASGEVTIMSPIKSASSENEGHVFGYVYAWNLKNKSGRVYSPSGGFLLDGKQMRCSDTAWVSNDRLAPFLADPDHRKKFVDAVPDFVVEVKSDTDRLPKLQEKMLGVWMASGVRLAWLIDTDKECVYIYRAGTRVPEKVFDFANSVLSGEDVLPEFIFPLVELNV